MNKRIYCLYCPLIKTS